MIIKCLLELLAVTNSMMEFGLRPGPPSLLNKQSMPLYS